MYKIKKDSVHYLYVVVEVVFEIFVLYSLPVIGRGYTEYAIWCLLFRFMLTFSFQNLW